MNENDAEKAILFLHPAFGDHTCFDEQIKYFVNDYKVITLDILGHGKSLGRGKVSFMSKWINQILENENINKINIVGVSLGAIIAQDFYNKFSNKVSSLFCVGGYDINNFDKTLQKENGLKQKKMMLFAIFSIKKFAKMNKTISAYRDEAQDRFYKLNLKFKKSSFKYFASLGSLVNKCKILDRKCPLFIGIGEKDNQMAIDASKLWHKNEPKSEFKIFDGSGHLVNMDSPEMFNMQLEKFINNIK